MRYFKNSLIHVFCCWILLEIGLIEIDTIIGHIDRINFRLNSMSVQRDPWFLALVLENIEAF